MYMCTKYKAIMSNAVDIGEVCTDANANTKADAG